MSKESTSAGLGVVFFTYAGSGERAEREAPLHRGKFAPEHHDLERLLPRFRENPRRIA